MRKGHERAGLNARDQGKGKNSAFDERLNSCFDKFARTCPDEWNFFTTYIDSEISMPKHLLDNAKNIPDHILVRELYKREGKREILHRILRVVGESNNFDMT